MTAGTVQTSRRTQAALISILAVGAMLRFWNVDAGLPYRIGVDEPVIAERALQILKSGDFNPHFFDYPGLYIYVQVLIGALRFVAGAMQGTWSSIDQLQIDHLFAWTRLFNAAIGTATIFVVYRAGTRWRPATGLAAAALLAVWVNHVRESHFALTDVPLTFLTALALLVSLRAHESRSLAWFACAGATVGMAGAVKYNGMVALVMPLAAAAAIRPARDAWMRAGTATAAAAGAFLLGAPYTLLDLPGFLNGFAYLAYSVGSRAFLDGASVYVMHLAVSIGWPGFAAIVAGYLWCLVIGVRDRRLASAAVLLIFPLVYFYVVATKELIFGRYLLPIAPTLCIVIGIFLADAARLLLSLPQPSWLRATAVGGLVAAFIVQPAVTGIGWSCEYGAPTTQDEAYAVIQGFIPKDSGVAVERSVLRLPESSYRAMVVRNLTDRTADDYLNAHIGYLVASSDAFGPILNGSTGSMSARSSYRELLEKRALCLPAIVPTAARKGPEIRICRLQTP